MFAETVIAKAACGIAGVSGVGLVMAQTPGFPIPKDLKTWPIQALLALITLASLTLVGFMVRSRDKRDAAAVAAQLETAKQHGGAVQVQAQTNIRLDELCQKIGDSINEQSKARTVNEAMCDELHRRPCIMGQIPHPPPPQARQ